MIARNLFGSLVAVAGGSPVDVAARTLKEEVLRWTIARIEASAVSTSESENQGGFLGQLELSLQRIVGMESKVVSNLINAMRAVTIAIVFTCLVEASGQRSSSGSVKAWSSTGGSYGKVWHLSIQADDSAIVSDSSELGAKSSERRFKISTAQREAIVRAAEEAQFFALPDSLGPSLVPIHGPESTLEIELRGRVHKVLLSDPASAKGPQVERFRRVWRAVVETSPLKPPL